VRNATFSLAALLAAVLVAGLGDGANAKPVLRVGYVTDAGTVPSERDLRGAPLLGFVRAVKQFDVQGRVVYVAPNQDPVGALESLARQKYDLIITEVKDEDFGSGLTAVDIVASKFPRVKFLLPDASVDTLFRPRPNVQGTVFRAEQAGYLAGYLAALMERRRAGRDVVSSVGGYKFWGVDRWIVGYNAGATKADPGVMRLTGYSWDFAVPQKCRTIARSQIARGSGVVFNVAGACGLGAVAAAKEHDVWAVGVDVDQSFLGRHVLTSAVIKYDRPIFEAIRRLVQGTLTTGGDTVYDLRNGGVGLGRISPSVPPALLLRLGEVRRQIVAGEIEVPLVSRRSACGPGRRPTRSLRRLRSRSGGDRRRRPAPSHRRPGRFATRPLMGDRRSRGRPRSLQGRRGAPPGPRPTGPASGCRGRVAGSGPGRPARRARASRRRRAGPTLGNQGATYRR